MKFCFIIISKRSFTIHVLILSVIISFKFFNLLVSFRHKGSELFPPFFKLYLRFFISLDLLSIFFFLLNNMIEILLFLTYLLEFGLKLFFELNIFL